MDEPLSNLVLARRVDLSTTGTQASSLKLNRAKEMKPLDWSAVRALRSELDSADKDRSGGAILLMGRGQAFSAGGEAAALGRARQARGRRRDAVRKSYGNAKRLSWPLSRRCVTSNSGAESCGYAAGRKI